MHQKLQVRRLHLISCAGNISWRTHRLIVKNIKWHLQQRYTSTFTTQASKYEDYAMRYDILKEKRVYMVDSNSSETDKNMRHDKNRRKYSRRLMGEGPNAAP
jgi:hypothetical protein